MTKKFLTMAAGVVLCLAVLAPNMFGEVVTVLGTCKDATGQPLVGATVELVNRDTGQKLDLKTNKKGQYFSLGVAIGNYDYKLLVNGQVAFHIDKVPVSSAQSPEFTQDFDLQKEAANAAKGQGLTPEQIKAIQEQKEKQEKETSTVKGLNGKLSVATTDMTNGDYDGAIATLNEANQMDPTRDVVWAQLGIAYAGSAEKQTDKDEKAKRYDEAIADFQKAIDLKQKSMKPNDETAKEAVGSYENRMGEAYAKDQKTEDAIKTYDQAVQADPKNTARYYYNEGAVLTNAGKTDDAIAAFDKAIAAAPDDPNHADSYYQKGVNLISKATVDKDNKMVAPPGTAEAFNKYLELKPDGPNAENAKQLLASLGVTIENSYGMKKKTTKK